MKRLSAALIATLLWWSPPALALTNGECLDCHRDATLTTQNTEGKDVSLYVGAAEFSSSVHADLGCTDCHQDAVEIPHAEGLKPVDCASWPRRSAGTANPRSRSAGRRWAADGPR